MAGRTTPDMHHKYNTSEKGRARQARYARTQKRMRSQRLWRLRESLKLNKEALRALE